MHRKSRKLKLPEPSPLAHGVIDRLVAYPWLGNVREMENVIERALIVSKGGPLTFDDLTGGKTNVTSFIPDDTQEIPLKLDEIVSRHISRVLEMAKGKIHGKGGAAEVLGINPSTLRNRMNRLRIPYGRKAGVSEKKPSP